MSTESAAVVFDLTHSRYTLPSPESFEETIVTTPRPLLSARDFAPGIADATIYAHTISGVEEKDELLTAYDGRLWLDDVASGYGASNRFGAHLRELGKATKETGISAADKEGFRVRDPQVKNTFIVKDNQTGIEHVISMHHGRHIYVANHFQHPEGNKRLSLTAPDSNRHDVHDILAAYLRVYDFTANELGKQLHTGRKTASAPDQISVRRREITLYSLAHAPEVRYMGAAALGGVPPEVSHETFTSSPFDKLGGLDKPIGEIQEALAVHKLMNDPIGIIALKQWGARVDSSILLHGPEGTGKSSLVEAIVEELGAEKIEVRCSNIIDKYIGNSGKNLAAVFELAKKKKGPVVLFLSEIDSLISHVGNKSSAADHEHGQVEGVFKQQMSDLAKHHPNVIVVADTNLDPQTMDGPLIRSGRFNTIVEVPMPDQEGREDIWHKYIAPDFANDPATFIHIDMFQLAKCSEGMTGADVENILNQVRLAKAMEQIKVGIATPITTSFIEIYIDRHRASRRPRKMPEE